ncbi:CHAT domain-containing protein [Pseudanabaena sp. PCC 6802]|uniref:CHAT domain-containing protein n=1 Tax=Pseudanabaena sp. PCC 6802 TaxID=118173 RepID=UPI0003482A6E|nr:CHAT domain-containing protein [Pseudanabaena sp. PCC 6802]
MRKREIIEKYAISTVVSADLTDTSDRLPTGTQNTNVFAAGLSQPVPGFSALPNVPAELDAIVRSSASDTKGIFNGIKLLDRAFNRKALRDNISGHRILHIATHGKFEPGSADASYLMLGDGNKLPIPEIPTALQDLTKVHLVVLSACETALGTATQDGTEIAGISYYFLNGGAKAVIASLWAVDDASTRLLMEEFYTQLAKSTPQAPITKAAAIRQAQLSLLHRKSKGSSTDFSYPHYWAPFVLIGNGF